MVLGKLDRYICKRVKLEQIKELKLWRAGAGWEMSIGEKGTYIIFSTIKI